MMRPEDGDDQLSSRPLEVPISIGPNPLTIDEAGLIAIVKTIAADANIQCGEISLAIVDDPTIHELNRNYLDHDYPTDVLSFPLDGGDGWVQGEIVVSADTAQQIAVDYGWSPESELTLYVIHGALHLVGYDDKQEDHRAEMRRAENDYLIQAGIEIPSGNNRPERAGWEARS